MLDPLYSILLLLLLVCMFPFLSSILDTWRLERGGSMGSDDSYDYFDFGLFCRLICQIYIDSYMIQTVSEGKQHRKLTHLSLPYPLSTTMYLIFKPASFPLAVLQIHG